MKRKSVMSAVVIGLFVLIFSMSAFAATWVATGQYGSRGVNKTYDLYISDDASILKDDFLAFAMKFVYTDFGRLQRSQDTPYFPPTSAYCICIIGINVRTGQYVTYSEDYFDFAGNKLYSLPEYYYGDTFRTPDPGTMSEAWVEQGIKCAKRLGWR